MRFNEVKKLIESQEDLFEINMSPSNLEKTASQIDARAGMEFEMIVPNVQNDDDDSYGQEPDWDQDESVTSIRDAEQFFHDGDHNGRRTIERLVAVMEEEYSNWAREQFDDYWMENAYELVYEYLRLNANGRDIVEILELEGGEAEEVLETDPTKQDYIKAAEKIMDEKDSSAWYDEARDAAEQDYIFDRDQQQEWLEHEGMETMRDVMDRYDNFLEWPYWYNPNTGGEQSISDVADNFENAIDRPVKGSSGYHSGSVRRQTASSDYYIIEPDGSLEPDDSNDAGLEFVSPPLPLGQMFSDLDKVKRWADAEGCYTNSSTGLHINVSVPGYDLNNLDYVKLALLMGDKYVLDQFERAGNTYCKSAMEEVKTRVRQRPEDAGALLQSMKNGLNKLASKVIHSGVTSKYTSINTKDNRIEFRSPGGDCLNDKFFAKIKPTLLRFVVSMDAALDPEKYRQEYLKKLYTVLQPQSKDDTLSYFAKYAAGELPKAALKSFVRQAQLERKIAKDPTGGQKYWWNVGLRSNSNYRIEVVGTSKDDAISAAMDANPELMRYNRDTDFTARPIRPYSDAPVRASVGEPQAIGQRSGPTVGGRPSNPEGAWILAPQGQNPPVPLYRFNASGIDDANNVVDQWNRENSGGTPAVIHYDSGQFYGQPPIPGSTLDLQRQRAAQSRASSRNALSQTDIENRLGWGGQEADANYEVIDRSNMQSVFKFIANTEQEAARKYSQFLDVMMLPHDTENYGWRAISSQRSDPYRSVPIPGVTDVELDIPMAPPRPLSAGRELVGWSVRLPNGREVTQIRGIGNNQGDANRIAADYLRQNGMGVSGEGFEVVPVWREA